MMVPSLPPVLDLAGIAVFALSGALLAARLRQTIVSMVFFALVTGVGGGSVRDLLIGAPVFWVRDPWVAPVILLTALIAWFTPNRWWEGKMLDWADALGLAVYSVLGTAKALAWGVEPVPAVPLRLRFQVDVLERPSFDFVSSSSSSAGSAALAAARTCNRARIVSSS